jgi:hypothetical protein
MLQARQHAVGVIEEGAGHADVLELLPRRRTDGLVLDEEDLRAGVGEEDRRVRRDDELAAALDALAQKRDEREDACGRERRLRLVE